MKVIVSGGTGFLGKAFCEYVRNIGWDVTTLSSTNCNLCNSDSLSQFDSEKYDLIFHLAAWTQAGDFCLTNPGMQWIINQKINTNMLDWWQKKQPQAKLICMGTSCSYDPLLSLVEDNYMKGTPIDSLYTYAMTKRMLLCGLQALCKQYNLRYLYLIPSTLYGPDYHQDGRQMHFIFDLIRKILAGKKYGSSVVLWGNGEQKRELIHVEDFIKAMLFLTEKEENTIVNVGSGQEHSIKEFAKVICTHAGYSFEKIQYDVSKYVGAKSKVLNIDRLQSIMPHFSIRDLDSGLKETIEWFKKSNMICSSSELGS